MFPNTNLIKIIPAFSAISLDKKDTDNNGIDRKSNHGKIHIVIC